MRRARYNSWDDEEENGVAPFSGNASVQVIGPSLPAQDKAFFAEIGQHVISALTDDLNNVDADYEERSGISTMDSSVKEWFENKLSEVFGTPWRIDAESQFGDLHAKTRTIFLAPFAAMSAPSGKWELQKIVIESTSGRTSSSPLTAKVSIVPRPAHEDEDLRELTEEDFEAIPNRGMASRRNPYSTGYVAAKIRENTARRNAKMRNKD